MSAFLAGGPAATAAPVPLVRRVFHRPPDLHPYAPAQPPVWPPPPPQQPPSQTYSQPQPPAPQHPASQWPAAPEVLPVWAPQPSPTRVPSGTHVAPSPVGNPFNPAAPAGSVWNGNVNSPAPAEGFYSAPQEPLLQANSAQNVVWGQSNYPEIRLPDPVASPLAHIAAGSPPVPWIQTPPRQWDLDDEVEFEVERPRHPVLGVLLLLLVAVAGWFAWQFTRPAMMAEIPVLNAGSTPMTGEAATSKTLPPAPSVTNATPIPVTPEASFEVRRAEAPPVPGPPPLDLLAANSACTDLVKTLVGTGPKEARFKTVAQLEVYKDSMGKFFAKHPKGLSITLLRMATRPAFLLPGGGDAALFQMTTDANTHGALIRLISDEKGGFLIDWPLFEETHERRLADFLEGSRSATPAWFHVGLRLTHAMDLPEAIREKFVSFELQASADDSVRTIACVEQETNLGRRLVREAQWGTVYLSKLLLQRLSVQPGKPTLIILDCKEPDELN